MPRFVQGQRKRSARFRKARLLIVALLPWLLLMLANGGRHNHSLSDAQDRARPAAVTDRAGVECQPAQAAVRRGEATRGSGFCPACRWQLSSGTYPVAGLDESAGHSPGDVADRAQIVLLPPMSRPFDSRAPPLV